VGNVCGASIDALSLGSVLSTVVEPIVVELTIEFDTPLNVVDDVVTTLDVCSVELTQKNKIILITKTVK
jgi:hypothetical protein